jgi:hypothetical protein
MPAALGPRMAESDARSQILALLPAGGGPMPTHELLDRLEGVSEVDAMEELLALVSEGVLTTRSDHGTVYFQRSGH